MTLTQRQIEATQKDIENICKENVQLEVICETIYAYCSELASLRLLKAYRKSENADAGYSENLKTFYFRLEL